MISPRELEHTPDDKELGSLFSHSAWPFVLSLLRGIEQRALSSFGDQSQSPEHLAGRIAAIEELKNALRLKSVMKDFDDGFEEGLEELTFEMPFSQGEVHVD